jgi:hypothetical protein
MNVTYTTLSERYPTRKTPYSVIPFINVQNKQIYKEKKICGCLDQRMKIVTADGPKQYFGGNVNVLKLDGYNVYIYNFSNHFFFQYWGLNKGLHLSHSTSPFL